MYTRKRITTSLLLMAILLLTLIFIVASATASPEKLQSEPAKDIGTKWSTYTDPRFDFTIEYPSDWYIIPRDDSDPKAMSGVVTFSNVALPFTTVEDYQAPHKINEPQIVIGHYLAEFEPNHSLSSWTDAYETVSNGSPPEAIYKHFEKMTRKVRDKNALTMKGESALLEFQATNILNGEVVWFIWTNIGDSATLAEKAIYEHVVSSFEFSEQTPKSLSQIYGEDFKPQPLEARRLNSAAMTSDSMTSDLMSPLATVSLPSPSTWIAPIASGNRYDVNCGSPEHVDDELHKYSRYAADIAMYLAPVKSAKTSWVDFAGWVTGGWGNMVTASTDYLYSQVYTMHYAHLSNISVYNGQSLGTGSHIGTSGNTSDNPLPYHLHFHVRSGANSVDLTGMSGFYPDSNYPDNFATCGFVQR